MMKRAAGFIGLVIGVVFLVFAFSQVHWDSFFLAVTSLKTGWVTLTALALFLSMFLRAIRWHLVTGLPRNNFLKVWDASCIGYLGTAIYPARAGDVMRMLRLQQSTGMGGGLAIGSAVIDRILDGLALCCLLLVVALVWVGDLKAQQGLWWLALVFLTATGAGIIFVLEGHRLRSIFQWLAARWPVFVRLNHWYEQSLAGLQILRSSRRILLVFVLQGVISFLDILACWLLFLAFGWNLPFMAAIVVLVYLMAAMTLPSTPGYVGVYQVATLFALRAFGIEGSAAVAYGTILQVLSLALFVGAGGWAYLKSRHLPSIMA